MESIVNAIILKNNKLLTIKRKTEPWPGMYGLPGGHIKEEENKIRALKREIKEETGLEVEISESDFLETGMLKYKLRRFKVFFYKAKIVGGKESPQKKEVEEIKWLGFNEFIQNLKEFGLSSRETKRLSETAKLAGCYSLFPKGDIIA